MATETWKQIRCDNCGTCSEPFEPREISEGEIRADLKKRFGWLMWKTNDGKRRDICPACVGRGK